MIRSSVESVSASTPTLEAPDTPVSSRGSSDIEDFIYLISHDVRGSVRALLELPQWIEEDLKESGIRIDGSVATSIDLMNRHTGRLDRMLVDLLAFSRVGRLQATQEIDLETALDDVLEEMKIPSGFRITRDLRGLKVVIGDRDLPTLLSALISNGIKHHDQDTGCIDVTARQQENEVILQVCDDGPGIEETFHERVFAPMTTLRPRDEVEGSGMGLANTRKIAAHYGGGARLVSPSRGRGTTVEVRLPARRPV